MVTTRRKCLRCKKWCHRDDMIALGPKPSIWTCRRCLGKSKDLTAVAEKKGKKKSSTAPAGSAQQLQPEEEEEPGAQTAVTVKKGTKKTKKKKQSGGEAGIFHDSAYVDEEDIFRDSAYRIDKHTKEETLFRIIHFGQGIGKGPKIGLGTIVWKT